ncbi:MAG: hypothetical protein ACRC8K_18655, partial [Waterburya sp.]
MNRCQNTGINRSKPYLNPMQFMELRKEIDAFIDKQMEKWNQNVPFATHFEGSEVHQQYYQRHLIETAWRIRLLRVA